MKRSILSIGVFIVLLSFIIHLFVMNDYGLTWDFLHHFFAGAKFFGLSWNQVITKPLPYSFPDPRGTYQLPYGPFISIIPFISYQLLYAKTHLFPLDIAYNLPIVLVGSLGPALLFLFLSQALKDKRKALIAAVFLFFLPRYFGDLHNNMKDIPMAVVFCLNVWLLWRLYTFRRLRDLLLASLGFAVAFSTKVNSLFIPILFGVFLTIVNLRESGTRLFRHPLHLIVQLVKKYRIVLLYFILAPLFAYLLWWFFWGDAVGELKLMFTETFLVGTNNIEVLFAGKWYCSGANVPWFYPYGYLAITTPLPILMFFLIGVTTATWQFLRKKDTTLILLVLWFFIPLTRYLSPKIGVIDGIRHFQEVVFPIVALAAIGFEQTISFLTNKITKRRPLLWENRIMLLALLAIITSLSWNIISYHPYQIAYYNELVGGIRGAFGKFDLDYWGSSQKQAAQWLNTHAEKNATVVAFMAPDVFGLYLRDDLLLNLNKISYGQSHYTVVLNRQSFFYRYFGLYDYLLTHTPMKIFETQGVPIVWIFDNTMPMVPRQSPWWQGEDPCIYKYW